MVRVDVKFNADHGNQERSGGVCCASAEIRSWFDRPYPCISELARISDFSGDTAGPEPHETPGGEVREAPRTVSQIVAGRSDVGRDDDPHALSAAADSVCAAAGPDDSIVVGADGSTTGAGFGSVKRTASCRLRGARGELTPGRDADWWTAFDPTLQPNCSRCSFLPVCWGGCRRSSGRQFFPCMVSLYWRRLSRRRSHGSSARLSRERLQFHRARPVPTGCAGIPDATPIDLTLQRQ